MDIKVQSTNQKAVNAMSEDENLIKDEIPGNISSVQSVSHILYLALVSGPLIRQAEQVIIGNMASC